MSNHKILGLLGLSAKARKIVSGADATIQAMEKQKIKLVLVSKDASEKTMKNFRFYSERYKIPIFILEETIEDISKAIGKKNRAIIGIEEENLAKQIGKILNGGDIIG